MLRTKTRKRSYPGKSQSYCLIYWLNHVRNMKARARVETFVDSQKQLGEIYRKRDFPRVSPIPNRRGLNGTKQQFANLRRARELCRTIRKILSHQRLSPVYLPTAKSWNLSWVNSRKRCGLDIPTYAGGSYDEIPFGESDAVFSSLRLAEQGYLDRLRKCFCGKWLYSKFKHQLFCSTVCQQLNFRKTDEFREHRRKFMRKHRATLARLYRQPGFKPRPERWR